MLLHDGLEMMFSMVGCTIHLSGTSSWVVSTSVRNGSIDSLHGHVENELLFEHYLGMLAMACEQARAAACSVGGSLNESNALIEHDETFPTCR